MNKNRVLINEVEPDAVRAMRGLEKYIRGTTLTPAIRELVNIRASQINGCAYCVDKHTREAMKLGETARRIFALSVWKESPLFTEEERAALQLTEEATLIFKNGVSDETYNNVVKLFGSNGFIQLMMQVVTINGWNRICIATQEIFEEANGRKN